MFIRRRWRAKGIVDRVGFRPRAARLPAPDVPRSTSDSRPTTAQVCVPVILLSNPWPRKYPFGWIGDGQSCRFWCVGRHTFGTLRCRSVTCRWGIIDIVDGERSGGGVRGRWASAHPVCALCAGPGAGGGGVAPHYLTHGVCVVLCQEHRSDAYQCVGEGQVFARELAGMWCAAGIFAARHRAALATHLRRVAKRRATSRARPGSYSWPWLRVEAERRFAAGEHPRRVIFELRASRVGGDAIVPSVRTMRRWFCDARWLARSAPRDPEPDGPDDAAQAPRRQIMSLAEVGDLVAYLTEPYAWWPFSRSRGSPSR